MAPKKVCIVHFLSHGFTCFTDGCLFLLWPCIMSHSNKISVLKCTQSWSKLVIRLLTLIIQIVSHAILGVASRRNPPKAVPFDKAKANGGWTEQYEGDAGGGGGKQEEPGEADVHSASAGWLIAAQYTTISPQYIYNNKSLDDCCCQCNAYSWAFFHYSNFPSHECLASLVGRDEKEDWTRGLISGGGRRGT